jgi:hypothetical protein
VRKLSIVQLWWVVVVVVAAACVALLFGSKAVGVGLLIIALVLMWIAQAMWFRQHRR